MPERELDHHVGPALDRPCLGMRCPEVECLVERPRAETSMREDNHMAGATTAASLALHGTAAA